jgi:hypothetical protein
MAEIQFPSNDNARSQFLKKNISATTTEEENNETPGLIPAELVDRGKLLFPVFDQKLSKINSLLSQRSREVSEKQKALTELNMWTRDFWEVLRRRTVRLDHPVQVLTHYQLPLNGITPKLSKEKDMLEIAQRVVDGEATAVAEGYPPMANPSAVELKRILDKAWKEVNDVPKADEAYDNAQEEIADLRNEVDELIRDIYDYMGFNLRKKDPASRRRIMQNYGFSFRYLKGEPNDEEISSN